MADGHFPTLVSATRDANSAANPMFNRLTDGTDLLAINADGSLNVVATATDLDIRDLTHVSDSVKVGDGTDFLAVNADGSINITDNGGSITVDANNLDIRDLNSATDSVTVVATNLDIRDLTHASDSVKVGDGTDFLAVNADGSINVVVSPEPGTKVHDHKAVSALASDASDNHDVTATGGTLLVNSVSFASSGGSKAVLIKDPTGANQTIWTGFIPKEGGEVTRHFDQPIEIADTDVVRLVVTNRQGQAQDVYSLIEGVQQ